MKNKKILIWQVLLLLLLPFLLFLLFAAMLEFALVNTLARKEIRRMSMRAKTHEKQEDSDMVQINFYQRELEINDQSNSIK